MEQRKDLLLINTEKPWLITERVKVSCLTRTVTWRDKVTFSVILLMEIGIFEIKSHFVTPRHTLRHIVTNW